MNLLSFLFKKTPIATAVEDASKTPVKSSADLGPVVPRDPTEDIIQLPKAPFEGFRTIDDYPTVDDFAQETTAQIKTGDSLFVPEGNAKHVVTMDNATISGQGEATLKAGWSAYQVPDAVMQWYNSQSFIGYQACSLMQQHWLIDKVCRMPGEDAVRNGYEVSVMNESDPQIQGLGVGLEQFIARVRELDKDFKINEHLVDMWRFTQVFGIRVCIFDVKSDDPNYYSKPFNIDGVGKGCYLGIKQVDPYWMMPVLSGKSTRDPTSRDFYIPEYWVIGGKKYHKSHLVIGRASEPADILKPAYIFGGIPLTQRIYERVYAAERTANEGPLLATSKRQTVLHTDLMAAEAQPAKFLARIMKWVMQRDNFGVKTVGIDDTVEQFDTSLADLDAVIMNQYQLVAAIGEVPATKLLGTSPKGFQSNGNGEEKNYHEKLESVQSFLIPLLDRHHQLLVKSEYGVDVQLESVWNRVDSFTAEELAELNYKKAQTGEILMNLGATCPDDERNRVKNDPLSGYSHLSDDDASTEMGMTPENEAKLDTANAKEETAGAQTTTANASAADPNDASDIKPHLDALSSMMQPSDVEAMGTLRQLHAMVTGQAAGAGSTNANDDISPLLQQLAAMFRDPTVQDGLVARRATNPSITPTMKSQYGGLTGPQREVVARTFERETKDDSGVSETAFAAEGGANWSHRNMPKVRVGRLTVVIENTKGSIRSGQTIDGQYWRTQMPHHYGFINGAIGADGDELDAFIGPDLNASKVYVINQVVPGSRNFDEHKVMFGFNSEDEALQAYEDSYQAGWDGYESHVEFKSLEDFRAWMRSADLNEPATA